MKKEVKGEEEDQGCRLRENERRWRERVKWKDQGCRLRENVKKEVKGDGEGLGSRGVD